MKKIIILLSTIFLVISCKSSYEYGCYYFTILSDGTVRFDGVHEKLRETISGTFYLPKKIYGREVTQIGERAFKDCKKLTDITILSTVTEIGNDAFYDCTNLESVTFEDPFGWKGKKLKLELNKYTDKKEVVEEKIYMLTLTNPKKNAEYLKEREYEYYYYWFKEAASGPPSDADKENSNMKDTIYRVNGVSFTMKPIAAVKDAVIGDNSQSNNKEHIVSLSAYYIGETEVTQELWQAVMGNNPSNFSGSAKNPVETINWYECIAFCNELTSKVMGENHCVYKRNGDNVTADFTKKGFRLPTEAEWEYAAMGGKKYKYAGCNSEHELKDYAWYKDNSDNKTHEVGQKKPNGYGLYDMSGNVWEWCWNWWSATIPSDTQSNPKGPAFGSNRVLRGGSWLDNTYSCACAFCGSYKPDIRSSIAGLRLVCRP